MRHGEQCALCGHSIQGRRFRGQAVLDRDWIVEYVLCQTCNDRLSEASEREQWDLLAQIEDGCAQAG